MPIVDAQHISETSLPWQDQAFEVLKRNIENLKGYVQHPPSEVGPASIFDFYKAQGILTEAPVKDAKEVERVRDVYSAIQLVHELARIAATRDLDNPQVWPDIFLKVQQLKGLVSKKDASGNSIYDRWSPLITLTIVPMFDLYVSPKLRAHNTVVADERLYVSLKM